MVQIKSAQKKKYHPIVWIDYPIRIIGHVTVLCAVASTLYFLGIRSWWPYVLLALQSFVYPQIALFFSMRNKNPKNLEYHFLTVDSFFIGCWVSYIDFAILPSLAMIIGISMAHFSMGGVALAIRGWITLIIGMILVSIFHGIHFDPLTSIYVSTFSSLVLFVFCCAMGYLTFKRAAELKETKSQLRNANYNLENLNRVLKSASSSLDLDTVTQQIVNTFNAFFAFDYVTLQMTDETHNELRFKAISGFGMAGKINDLTLLHPKLNYENCLSVKAYLDNTVIYIPEISRNLELSYIDKNIHEITSFNSLIYIPLTVQDKQIGVIGFLSRKSMTISEPTIKVIRLQISNIALILRNAVLYDDLKHSNI